MSEKKYDSLIFDMDGTLWDAVDSYVVIWNRIFSEAGINREVTRTDLLDQMGKPLEVILSSMLNEDEKKKIKFKEMLDALSEKEATMMPVLGGKLYDGVEEGIAELHKHYKLFMVSNCGAFGLKNFLNYTGLEPYFTDTLTNGETGLDKADNIRLLVEKNNLKTPAYVGDIQRDSDAAHSAGIDMIHVTYGFGKCNDAQLQFNSFKELTEKLA